MTSISIIGLGKLGAPFAACFAARDFDVVGIDTDQRVVDAMNAHEPLIQEPNVAELLREHGDRFHATTDYCAIADTDATFVIVPTPSPPELDGAFSTAYVEHAMRRIGGVLHVSEGYHLVVLMSTVMPGDCDEIIIPKLYGAAFPADHVVGTGEQLEEVAAAWAEWMPEHVGFCYSPEFIALGQVVADFLYPEFVIIGEADARSGDALEKIYRQMYSPQLVVRRMSLVNAELTKIALNNGLTDRIDYANWLAALCERIPGADVDVVTTALGCDSRIGGKYLKGALGFGGPCFPRDTRAMAALARRVGLDDCRPQAVSMRNDAIVERVVSFMPGDSFGRVTVLGATYKTGTPVTEESQGTAIAAAFMENAREVWTYDPMLPIVDMSAQECVDEADVVIITLPYPNFAALQFHEGQTVIDCWRIVDRETLPDGVRYVAIGRG